MPVQTISVGKVIQIARDATGRTDVQDPAFTDPLMLDRLNLFLQTEHPQTARIYQNNTWWTFQIDQTSLDPLPVDLDGLSYSTIGSLCYINGFVCFWYEDPALFYAQWPETQTYQPTRPTYVLYYNNELTFRGPPDQQYDVKIQAYKIDLNLDLAGNIPSAYLARYFAYGMSLDILADYGEMDKYAEVMEVYKRYRNQVIARTNCQLMSQRATPQF